jgi:hypothetical protein
MDSTELDWVPLNIKEETHSIRNLCDESIAAFVRLRIEFFSKGRLPTHDDAISRIVKLQRPRQWLKVNHELKSEVFTEDWRNPDWESTLKAAQARIASGRARTAPATAARAARRQAAPAPEVDPDFEPIPF